MVDNTGLQKPSKSMEYGVFITLVAKDEVVKTFGNSVKNWPDENFWAMVSSIRKSIQPRHIEKLMKQYNVQHLANVSSEVRDYFTNGEA